MKLTKAEVAVLCAALEDAISDRESFIQAHYTTKLAGGRIKEVVMAGCVDLVRRHHHAVLKRYHKLRDRAWRFNKEGKAKIR